MLIQTPNQFLFAALTLQLLLGTICLRYIHCGDMRYSDAYMEDPLMQQFKGTDGCFLDTTYCKPRYNFPAQVPILLVMLLCIVQS